MLKECAICLGGVVGGLLFGPGDVEHGRFSSMEIGEPGSTASIRLECRKGKPSLEMCSDTGMKVSVTVGKDIEWTMGLSGKDGPAVTVWTDAYGDSRLQLGVGTEGQRIKLENQPGRLAAVTVFAGSSCTPAVGLAAMGESPPDDGLPGSRAAAMFTIWSGSPSDPAAYFRSTHGLPLDWKICRPDGNPRWEGSAK